jgi:hypothetical protein
MANGKSDNLKIAPKRRWARRKFGMKLELCGVSWLKDDYGFDDLLWNNAGGGADVTLFGFGEVKWKIEFEMKRLKKTKFVTRSWLKTEVVDKFSPDAKLKILVVTKTCWHPRDDLFLLENGIRTIEVGSVDREKDVRRAKERFLNAFTRIWVDAFLKDKEVEELCQERLFQ